MKNTRDFYLGNPNLPTDKTMFEWTPQMVKELKKSKKDLLYFAENFFFIINLDEGRQKIKLHKCQKRTLKKMNDNRFFILLASRQVGKALALDTPIPTPKGWTTMGELIDGDVIYGSNGLPCNVVKAHDVMYNRECYKITFDNGETIVADGDHLWFTQSKLEQDIKCEGSVKTTKEMFDTVEYNSESMHRIPAKNKLQPYWHYIKMIEKVESVPVRCITVDSDDSLFLVGKNYIPTHNTTLMTIYSLWHACFNNDQRVLIVANKEDTAKEIFSRIRMAYEELPNYLKPGVVEYGKESMKLTNGSVIGISTTTGTAARGQSINLMLLDELAFIECVAGDTTITVRNKRTGEILDVPINDFIEKLSKNNKFMQTDITKFYENEEWEILTDTGWQDFEGIAEYEKRQLITIKLSDDTTIDVSENHGFINESGETILAKESLNAKIKTKTGFATVVNIVDGNIDYVYDAVEVKGGNTYYTNNVLSHNTHIVEQFWKSVFPVISSSKKSKIFIASTANGTNNLFYNIWSGAIEGKNGWGYDKILWDEVPGRDAMWKYDTIRAIGSEEAFNQEFQCVTGKTLVDVNNYNEQQTIEQLWEFLQQPEENDPEEKCNKIL